MASLKDMAHEVFRQRHDHDLPTWIAARRDEGIPWRKISEQLRVETDGLVDVAPQTLINWFEDQAVA